MSQTIKPPPWHSLIIADLLLSELATGLFVVSAIADLVAGGSYGAASRIGYLLAFPLMMADLVCLVMDLGDPIRFYHMLRVLKLRSPMSTGVWAINVFAFISFIAFVMAALNVSLFNVPRVVVGGIGLAPALYVAGYKGVMLSATAQPGWKNARWLGGELVTSAGLMGVSALLLVTLFLPVPSAMGGMRLAQLLMICVNLALSVAVIVETIPTISHERRLDRLAMYALVIVGGWVAPLILNLLGGRTMLAAAACLVLIGAVVFRQDLVMLPHRT